MISCVAVLIFVAAVLVNYLEVFHPRNRELREDIDEARRLIKKFNRLETLSSYEKIRFCYLQKEDVIRLKLVSREGGFALRATLSSSVAGRIWPIGS